jgi:hypothetical protein
MSKMPSPQMTPEDDTTKVSTLFLRFKQIETVLGLAAMKKPKLDQFLQAAIVDVSHPGHHRAFEIQRLHAVLERIKVAARPSIETHEPVALQAAWDAYAPTDVVWRNGVYPGTVDRAQLEMLISQLPQHPDEVAHAIAVLVNAMADSAQQLDEFVLGESWPVLPKPSAISGALRGASAMSAAGRTQHHAAIDREHGTEHEIQHARERAR